MSQEPSAADDATPTSLDGEELAPAPSGDLCIVFTDIEESTTLWDSSPDAMRKAIEMHDNLMRETIRVHHGYEVKAIGDAFMVAFPKAASALLWCLEVQRQLLDAHWPPEILENVYGEVIRGTDGNVIFRGLRVRMGIHWGKSIRKKNEVTGREDYIGPMVHRVARTIDIAEGGQIVVSRQFLNELRREFAEAKEEESNAKNAGEDASSSSALLALSQRNFEIRDLGEKELKGLSDDSHLYLIVPESLLGRLDQESNRYLSISSLWNWMKT